MLLPLKRFTSSSRMTLESLMNYFTALMEMSQLYHRDCSLSLSEFHDLVNYQSVFSKPTELNFWCSQTEESWNISRWGISCEMFTNNLHKNIPQTTFYFAANLIKSYQHVSSRKFAKINLERNANLGEVNTNVFHALHDTFHTSTLPGGADYCDSLMRLTFVRTRAVFVNREKKMMNILTCLRILLYLRQGARTQTFLWQSFKKLFRVRTIPCKTITEANNQKKFPAKMKIKGRKALRLRYDWRVMWKVFIQKTERRRRKTMGRRWGGPKKYILCVLSSFYDLNLNGKFMSSVPWVSTMEMILGCLESFERRVFVLSK